MKTEERILQYNAELLADELLSMKTITDVHEVARALFQKSEKIQARLRAARLRTLLKQD